MKCLTMLAAPWSSVNATTANSENVFFHLKDTLGKPATKDVHLVDHCKYK